MIATLLTRQLTKAARTAAQFTFATKYPKQRQSKPIQKASVPKRLALQDTHKNSLEHQQKFALVQEKGKHASTSLSFDSFGLHEQVVFGIEQGLGFSQPSPIQTLLFKQSLASDAHTLAGSQCGSGKTLAYLAPLFHHLKVQEEHDPTVRKVGKPRALILTPSRQLVEQVTRTGKTLSHYCKMRIVGIHGATKRIDALLEDPVDILATTPSTLKALLESQQITLQNITKVVVDEADTLFDSHFEKGVKPLLDKILAAGKGQDRSIPFTFVTATFPKTLENAITTTFQPYTRLTTTSLHKIPSAVKQQFFRVGGSTTKENLLLEAIKRSAPITKRMMVFCNRKETVEQVAQFLQQKRVKCVALSSEQDQKTLKDNMKAFLAEESDFMVCVSTDMGSRGLDTVDVGHVILYEFPQTSIDYIHRVGRTARFGRPGWATSFVTVKDVPLADTIQKTL